MTKKNCSWTEERIDWCSTQEKRETLYLWYVHTHTHTQCIFVDGTVFNFSKLWPICGRNTFILSVSSSPYITAMVDMKVNFWVNLMYVNVMFYLTTEHHELSSNFTPGDVVVVVVDHTTWKVKWYFLKKRYL